MPLQWKIFFALNFVLSLPAFVCFILLAIEFLNISRSGEDYFFGFLFLFGLLMITLNGFLNIYLFQRFFPDKTVSQGIKRLNVVSLVLNILAAIGILVICIYGASIEFSRNNYGRDSSGKIALAIIFLLWIVQVFVLIMQGRLPGVIGRNNREKMHSLIDSIGQ